MGNLAAVPVRRIATKNIHSQFANAQKVKYNHGAVKWYYSNGEKPVGPMERAELESLFSSGVVSTNTFVLQEGMYDWIPYQDLKKTTQFLPVRKSDQSESEKLN